MRRARAWLGAAMLLALAPADAGSTEPSPCSRRARGAPCAEPFATALRPPIGRATGWRDAGNDGVRGVTVGPIENGYHPGKGYGSEAFDRSLDEAARSGATWIALTPFGRVASLEGAGVDPTFEAPFAENVAAVERSVAMAHARGLRVLLVPHLWVESGEWRAKIDPGTPEGWARWAKSYRAFVLAWARASARSGVDMMSVGVELRSWVTGPRAASFLSIIEAVRAAYRGLLLYSANWDDVDDTAILGALDVIGINAFYPLGDKDGAPFATLLEGGARVRDRVRALADRWNKPVLFTEIGYTTRPNPAIRPWEWPETMKRPKVDEIAQAEAYRALLAPMLDEPRFAGFFVWRTYADPDDTSQEPEWGFSPRGKRAELVMRDAFSAPWAGDGATGMARSPFRRAFVPGLFP